MILRLLLIHNMNTIRILTLTCALSTIDECFTNITVSEHAWGTNVVPILTGERVNTKHETP